MPCVYNTCVVWLVPKGFERKKNACTVETNLQNTEQNMKLKLFLQLQGHSIIFQVPNSILKTEEALNEMFSLTLIHRRIILLETLQSKRSDLL